MEMQVLRFPLLVVTRKQDIQCPELHRSPGLSFSSVGELSLDIPCLV